MKMGHMEGDLAWDDDVKDEIVRHSAETNHRQKQLIKLRREGNWGGDDEKGFGCRGWRTAVKRKEVQ
jgi:hypothetical protein